MSALPLWALRCELRERVDSWEIGRAMSRVEPEAGGVLWKVKKIYAGSLEIPKAWTMKGVVSFAWLSL